MNNYQLYRTNVLLGGQMKWDIIIDSDKNTSERKLTVADFHLSPISKNTNFTYNQDNTLLNNSHQNNVKAYYNKTKTYFYKENLNHNFNNCNPILYKNNETPCLYSNTFDAGLRRSNYQRYNKQFEYFCPIWIEQIKKNITFNLEVIACDNNMTLSSADLQLKLTLKDLTDKTTDEYHRKFAKYLKNYIDAADLPDGDDELINISLKNNSATVKGLDVKSGRFTIKPYNSLTHNLIQHERPLIENDNFIIKSFEQSGFICKQLFNFNICFNIEDIVPAKILSDIYGNNIKVKMTVSIDDKILEKKDFYTNYEYVPAPKDSVFKTDENENVNALDYLFDYKYVNTMDKNKFCQSICHWSLSDNDNYIFNLYKGFDVLVNHKILDNSHVFNVNSFEEYESIANKDNAAHIYKSYYVNNTKYFYKPTDNYDEGIYLLGVIASDTSVIRSILNTYGNIKINKITNTDKNDIGELYILTPDLNDNLYIMLCINDNVLNSGNMYKIYDYLAENNLINSDSPIEKIYKTFINYVNSSYVKFNKTIYYAKASSPLDKTDEITYYVKENVNENLIRCDGKIKPAFTSDKPNIYYKEKILDSEYNKSIYSTYANSNYKPKYPSINFYGIKKLSDDWQFDKLPMTNILGNNIEYTWFDDNKYILLNKKILATKYSNKNGVHYTIEDAINEMISEAYDIDINLNKELINYIRNLYKFENNWQYASNVTADDYIYHITIELK